MMEEDREEGPGVELDTKKRLISESKMKRIARVLRKSTVYYTEGESG